MGIMNGKLIGKKSAKQEREHKVLLGLIEYYLTTGKPVGSNTLKEAGFEDLSSATIRNYFSKLEEAGYLAQQHASGGRVPTERAFRLYAQEHLDDAVPLEEPSLKNLRSVETREIAAYLQRAAEILSTLSNSAVFLSAPRFDQDYISSLKLLPIDPTRCLCAIITDFGVVKTEVLPTERKMSAFMVKRLESYFNWRLTGNDRPSNMELEEEQLAQKYYNEMLMRYIVGNVSSATEEVYRTGFSKLLSYPELHHPTTLASSLALFENAHSMRLLLKECSKVNQLKFWMGDDLSSYCDEIPACALLAIPYTIGQQTAGAVGLMGPLRMPYRHFFSLLRAFSESISTALTRSIYKFKITFQQPQMGSPSLMKTQSQLMLLEDKRN